MRDELLTVAIATCTFVTACFAGMSFYVLRDILKKTGAFVVIIPDAEEKSNEKV